MSEHSKLDYIQLALRVCDLNVSANVIDLILRLNTQDNNLKNLTVRDILVIKKEVDEKFKNEQE